MGSSLFWSCVAHLVSLHSSYSHRTHVKVCALYPARNVCADWCTIKRCLMLDQALGQAVSQSSTVQLVNQSSRTQLVKPGTSMPPSQVVAATTIAECKSFWIKPKECSRPERNSSNTKWMELRGSNRRYIHGHRKDITRLRG